MQSQDFKCSIKLSSLEYYSHSIIANAISEKIGILKKKIFLRFVIYPDPKTLWICTLFCLVERAFELEGGGKGTSLESHWYSDNIQGTTTDDVAFAATASPSLHVERKLPRKVRNSYNHVNFPHASLPFPHFIIHNWSNFVPVASFLLDL